MDQIEQVQAAAKAFTDAIAHQQRAKAKLAQVQADLAAAQADQSAADSEFEAARASLARISQVQPSQN